MVLAHAGHWAVQLLYIAPIAVLLGAIAVGKIRERRDGTEPDQRASHEETP